MLPARLILHQLFGFYHSHVDSVTEIYDGLIGTIIVTKKGMQRSSTDPRPKDIDTAFTTMFMIFDENGREKIQRAREKINRIIVSIMNNRKIMTVKKKPI